MPPCKTFESDKAAHDNLRLWRTELSMSTIPPGDLTIRPLQPADSLAELTGLLARAYAALDKAGLCFVASWQTEEMTRERISKGFCLVAVDGGQRLCGTVMIYPHDPESLAITYRHQGVVWFGKFAVEPELQGRGLGKRLFEEVERRARIAGAKLLACDTAKPATHLVEMYRGWGMKVVEEVDWPMTNYLSVLLAKEL